MITTVALTASSIPQVSSLVGKTFLSTAISQSCHDILTKITSLYSNPSFGHLVEELEGLDLDNSVKIINAHIEEIEKHNSPEILETHQSLFLSIQGLHNIINLIKEQIDEIHNLIENHNKKWFSSWRSVGGEEILAKLHLKKHILTERTDLFFKVCSTLEKID